MKRSILILIACIATFVVHAQSDATLKNVTETYTLHSDGSIDYNYSKVVHFHTHYSFCNLFGETFVIYNPEYQEVKINHCYTIQKDGKRIDAPANAFNRVLPKVAADAPAYNHLVELVITHTGLELGATVYLDYTITTKPGMVDALEIDRIFSQQGADIQKYQVNVNLPEGVDLKWELTDSKVKPTVKGNSYSWTLRNLPGGSGEALTPRNQEGLPRLTATTAESLESSLVPFTMETRDLCRLPADLLANATNDEEKATAIQQFVVNGLGNCGVLPEWTGYRLRQCGEVLRTAYGTVAEKAFAMARLMRAEGLTAEVILTFPKGVVKCPKTITAYLVRCNDIYYTVATTGKMDVTMRADREELYDLRGNRIEVDDQVKELNQEIQVTLSAEENEIFLRSEDGNSVALPKYGKYIRYTLPDGKGVDSWNIKSLASMRQEMIEIPYRLQEKELYTLLLSGVDWTSDPREIILENEAGKVYIAVRKQGDRVLIERYIRLNKSIYTAKEYPALRKLLLAWESKYYRELLFVAKS